MANNANRYPDVPAGKNYDAWRTELPGREAFAALGAEEKLRVLALAGHLAPSTHNTQPWRFRLDHNAMQVDVFLNRPSILPASDVKGRQTAVSIGCAVENIRTAAGFYGYTTDVIFPPLTKASFAPTTDASGPLIHAATVSLIKKDDVFIDEKLFCAIPRRKMLRAEFDPSRAIPEGLVPRAHEAIADTAITLHPVSDAVRRLALAEFQGQADGFVINSPAFSHELGSWLLPNDSASPVGMPGSNFGLTDAQALRMHKGLVGEAPLEPEDGLRFALAGKLGIEKSPLICVLTAPDDEPRSWIAGGVALERLLLFFTSVEASAAVHAGIVEVGLVNRMFAATLGTTRRIVALFRVGFPKRLEDASRPHSPRLPLDAVLL